jgi:hypothetical protein
MQRTCAKIFRAEKTWIAKAFMTERITCEGVSSSRQAGEVDKDQITEVLTKSFNFI